MSGRKIVGLFLMVLGAIGGGYSVVTYSNDTSKLFFRYTYSAPFTTHEITVISIFVVSLLLVIFGIIMLAASSESNSSSENLGGTYVEGVKDTIYCPFCGHKNQSDSKFCNSCGKEL